MSAFNNLKFSTKILVLGIGSVLITIVALVGTVVWQSAQFNALAQVQFARASEADLGHIVEGAYNMIEAQDQVVQEQANSGLNVAQQLVHDAGGVRLGDETVDWQATNEVSQQTMNIHLPKMYVGDTWLGKMTGRYDTTPIVDHTQMMVGGNATIYQRMNEQGDMLRVATNVLLPNKQRAIGTYVPATNPDGAPNPIIAAVLRGSIYRGSNFVIDAWYNGTYAPIRDESGQVIGMMQVGMKQQNVDAARQAILRAKVGETGNVDVLGSDGKDRGRYIITRNGQRDGENVWNTQSADGSFPIQSLIERALTLKLGKVDIVHYQWQDPGDPAPRSKVAGVTYYAPWHWVIVVSMDESEIQANQRALEEGQTRMIVVASAVGVALALIAGFLSVLIARSIARPVIHLADVAMQVSGGNLQVVAKVENRDEIGTLGTAFNSMTAQLRSLIGGLEERVDARTAQLRASADVGRTAASVLELDDLLHRVVNLITDRFGFYYAAVFITDSSGRNAVLREATGEAGRILKEHGHQLEVDGQSMVGYAITHRGPRIALDVGEEAVRFANPLLPDTRSEIALPLMIGDQVLGALDVQSTQEAAFDEANAAVLQSMADQIAVALSNAQQFKQTDAALRRARMLYTASQALSAANDPSDVLAALMNNFAPDAGRGGIMQYGPLQADGQLSYLELVATWAHPELSASMQPFELGARFTPQQMPLVNYLVSDRSFLISDSSDLALDPPLRGLMERFGAQAFLALQLTVAQQTLGVVVIGYRTPRQFDADQLQVMQALAGQAATVLQNLRSAADAQAALAQLDAINRRLTSGAWSEYLRHRNVEGVRWFGTTDRVTGGNLPEVSEALRGGQIVTRLLEDRQQLGIAVPIKLRDEPVGALRLIVPKHMWNPEMATALDSIAGHIAQASENARLIAETEDRLAREHALAEATEKVRQRSEIEAVLQTAATELARYLNASRIVVRMTPEHISSDDHGQ